MARKKEVRDGEHILFLTTEAISTINKVVDKDSCYKEKFTWKMKYMLAFSSLVERTTETGKEFVPVSIRIQRKILKCDDSNCCKIYDNLLKAGVIEQSRKNYKTQKHSFEYKPVISQLIEAKVRRSHIDKKTDEMLTQEEIKITTKKLSETEVKYLEVIRKITMDSGINEVLQSEIEHTKDCIKYHSTISSNFVPSIDIPELTVATSYLTPEMINVIRIMEGKFEVKRPDKASRIYTRITNLAKKYRPYLRLDGKPLIGCDIANSQPLLAAIIFREYSIKQYGLIKDDVLEYQAMCEAGQFYEYFMALNDIENSQRGAFKKKFFGCVYFNQEKTYTIKLRDQFKEKYPTCYEAMFALKGGYNSESYPDFAIGMQRIEAEIVVGVNIELIDMGINAVNIFDSIYVTDEIHLSIVKEKLAEKFGVYGIKPKFKTEDYRKKVVLPLEHFINSYGEKLGREIYELEIAS